MKARTERGTFAKRVAACHPDKRHKGNGLCVTCYSRERASRNRVENRARSKAWYAANTDKAKASVMQWLRANRGRHRESVLRNRYGLSPSDEQAILTRQDYRCPICGDPFDGRSKASVACVDHDHATGRVRGFLHFKCNAGIGALGDSAERLRRAVAYLEAAS